MPPMSPNPLPPFLQDGVRFTCVNCGACCTGAPGRVRVTESEIQEIARFLGEPEGELRKRATRPEAGGLGLCERDNGDCVFFENERCSVHPVKPRQCRLYPFWFRNVRSLEAWERTQNECPGIGQGEWIQPEEILRQVNEDLEGT